MALEELLKEILEEIKKNRTLDPNGVYSLQDLAEYFNCSEGTPLKWTKNGLKHKRVGRKIYVVGKDVLDFFNDDSDLSYSESSKDRIERKLRNIKL